MPESIAASLERASSPVGMSGAEPFDAASGQNAGSSGPHKLSDLVYERILAQIVDGRHAVGDRLPTEYQLAAEFQVSRPIVREALARLRDDGVIYSRRGSGTYVQRAPSKSAIKLTPLSSIADMGRCFEFRLHLEGEIAFVAAQSATPQDEADLTAAFQALDAAVAANALGVDEDHAFHGVIARTTGNRFFEAALAALRESVLIGMTVTRSLSLLRPRDRMLAVHDEHREILAAILAHEPERARRAMRTHIENARRRVFEGTES